MSYASSKLNLSTSRRRNLTDPTSHLGTKNLRLQVKKRIIVCCDGTWQDGLSEYRSKFTNVLRLSRSIKNEDDRSGYPIPQIVFYQSGVGTAGNFYSHFFDGATGNSLAEKVEEAYAFIAHNYYPGDEIFLFGFSRGAYTARIIAMLIGEIGVLDRREMDDFAEIFQLYEKLGDCESENERSDLKIKLSCWTDPRSTGRQRADPDGDDFTVKCLGVFDTVDALGMPEEISLSRAAHPLFGLPDRILGQHVGRAYHALALNEERVDFDCVKFEQTDIGRRRGQILQQCWFAGVHSDIGGGYKRHDLADLTLIWMAARIGDILLLDIDYMARLPQPIASWGKQLPHDSRTGIFAVARSVPRPLPLLDVKTFESIHPSVLEQDIISLPLKELIKQHPQLLCKLMPLEEELKVNWPYYSNTLHMEQGQAPVLENKRFRLRVVDISSATRPPNATIITRKETVVEHRSLFFRLMKASSSFLFLPHLKAMSSPKLVELRESHNSKPSPRMNHPQPISARFIRKPNVGSGAKSYRPLSTDAEVDTLDVTDIAYLPINSKLGSAGANTTVVTPTEASDNEDSSRELLKIKRCPSYAEVPIQSVLRGDATTGVRCKPHVPVPATVVFDRGAAPLYLPELDKHLAELPPPPFRHGGVKDSAAMFPPMDKLARSGMTLADLEVNSKIAPVWRNRETILGATVNIMLGVLGSSALASFYSLQGLFNTVQIFALLLSTIVPVKGRDLKDSWRKLLLGTIPNVLAFNFASTLVQSLLFLITFMAIAFSLLYIFYRSMVRCNRYYSMEGFQSRGIKSSQWGPVVVTFVLTVVYLPLSTMAVHVLVWSQDLWIVPNPYINATSYPPSVPPLGPPNVYREPLDFCWTTTMKRNQINYAPLLVILAVATLALLTVWFPLALRHVTKQSVPSVDKFTELGRRRNTTELDSEYQRLLSRDRNPFAFLYNGFRRGWGTYESTYLFAKLSALVTIAVIDSDNCLFRSVSRSVLPVARQVLLLALMIAFFVVQCIYAPFLDPVNNASEWTSRLNYVTTSLSALLIALNIPGKKIVGTYVLYTIYVVTYGLTLYFTTIDWDMTQRLVKRIARRIDFSLDIFSPRLDISKSSIHVKRRIWQESITTLFLTSPNCAIPKDQPMNFSEARDDEYPPYLLDFAGSPGERHVENLKILREIGSFAYSRAVALTCGPDHRRYQHLEALILKKFTGPDCYWKRLRDGNVSGHSDFGNAWWIPFSPSLVFRYDDGHLVVLHEMHDLEEYIVQNTSREIQRRRQIRLALRALEGLRVKWPYEHIMSIGGRRPWLLPCCNRKRYHASSSRRFETCTLLIKHRGYLMWNGLQLGSGFDIQLAYAKDVQVSADVIGLNDDFDLTAPLAKFMELNQKLITSRIQRVEESISGYRHHQRQECQWKRRVLSYRFLSFVYDQPREPDGLAASLIEHEQDIRVRQLMAGSEAVFDVAYIRYAHVTQTRVNAWWYIFWDDLWRRNNDTIAGLKRHAPDFNPHYPTSIAYTPLPRPALESFLIQRGLLSKSPHRRDYFHSGFLNKIYLSLNEIVFRASHQAILFHVGDGNRELDMEDVDLETLGRPSSLGTGGGTDHDASGIHARPAYRWEGLLGDPVRHGKRRRKLLTKLGAWFGITPLWRTGLPSNGLSLDVRLENGRYVVINHPQHCS
ncbi:hypothetical protein AX17_000848 [Amanita inopinata Kibby_2008]|nr:hypothetical protein AX17_000848 [Amanita inopinata Kibby_2008]